MRTETITRDIYTLDELDDAAQQRAILEVAGRLCEWWDPREATESINDWLADVLGTRDLKVIEWDTDRAQHVGFAGSFNAGEVRSHLKEMHAEYPEWAVLKWLVEALPDRLPDEDFHVGAANPNYHVGSWSAEDLHDANSDMNPDILNVVEDAWGSWLDSLRAECLTYLTAEVEAVDSEETVRDFIEANEVEFLADGSVA